MLLVVPPYGWDYHWCNKGSEIKKKKVYQSTTETFSLMSICKAYLISRLLLCVPVWIMAPACITFLWFKKKERERERESLRRCPERQNTAWSDSQFQAHVSNKRRLLRELHKVLSEWIPVMMFLGNVGEQIFHHIIRKKRFDGVLFSEGCVQPWKIAGGETCPLKLQPSQRCSLHPVLIKKF